MLLHLSYNSHPSLPPKHATIQLQSSSSLLSFPSSFRRTYISHKPKSRNFLIRSSLADTETLPRSAIQRIADKLRSLGFTEENISEPEPPAITSAGEIFVPLPENLPKYRVGHTLDPSWSTPENPVPVPGSGNAITRINDLRSESKRQKQLEKGLWKKPREESLPTLAELSLSKRELRRLQAIGIPLSKKLKIGKAGITEGIVNGIHERWRHSEVVKIVCEDFCKMNMKRTHDLLERKTGGLVVWRSGSKVVLYRGDNYKYPYFFSDDIPTNTTSNETLPESCLDYERDVKVANSSSSTIVQQFDGPSPSNKTQPTLIKGVGSPNRVRFQLPSEEQISEEADRLLDGLGPRFTDWWGYEPLPVDADLLPAVVRGYKRPFRLLPYGVQPKLTNDEMTTLRRLGRPLPCHFALGRNRRLHGLAAAIIKLWEKCEIAKVAVKRGIPNTNSEMMAEELKQLTGGTLLSRDKEFIIFYRGKDFLPSAVSSAIEVRRKHGLHGENRRKERGTTYSTAQEIKMQMTESDSKGELDKINTQKKYFPEEKRLRSKEKAIERTSMKLSLAQAKKVKVENLLAELEKAQIPQPLEVDKEGITEEERFMLRKVGLRMKPFLLLGRRGVFAGTVENMHLHWKYRELVKIISNEKSFEAVYQVAQILEAESGGILVAIERVRKGYAIIIYRGKNYQRPACLRPQTLLNKREAMKRSLEAQRRESLKLHVLKLTRNIDDLELQLVKENEPQLPNIMKSASELGLQVVGGNHEDNTTSSGLDDCLDPSMNGLLSIQEDKEIIDLPYLCAKDEGSITESYHSSDATSDKSHVNLSADMIGDNGSFDSASSCTDDILSDGKSSFIVANRDTSTSDREETLVQSTQVELTTEVAVSHKLRCMPSETVRLSNKDRLLLRKQALKMKNRPVLAIGRSNVVAGVARAIKTHFRKHPLAIVNVKGRAKGTSVQEVIFKLEQATGAVLVSHEPSKVILYRGWGAGYEPSDNSKKETKHLGKMLDGQDAVARPPVSPELLTAIRLECGLL